VTLHDVALLHCGKNGKDQGAVYVKGISNSKIALNRNKFVSPESAGLYISNSQNVQADSNVFYMTMNNSVILKDLVSITVGKPVAITNNLVITNRPLVLSNTQTTTGINYNIVPSAFLIENIDKFLYKNGNFEVLNNIVSGSAGAAYASPAMACSGDTYNSVDFYGNVAHSSLYGWIVTGYGVSCLDIGDFRAYTTQEGLISYSALSSTDSEFGSLIVAHDLIMTDNINSISINAGFSGVKAKLTIRESFIGGTNMVDMYTTGNESCDGITGFRLSTITTEPITWPQPAMLAPFYRIRSPSIYEERVDMIDIIFQEFNNGQGFSCANVSAFKQNYYDTDTTALHMIYNSSFLNVGDDNVFTTWPQLLDPTAQQADKTVFDYSGRYNFLIKG